MRLPFVLLAMSLLLGCSGPKDPLEHCKRTQKELVSLKLHQGAETSQYRADYDAYWKECADVLKAAAGGVDASVFPLAPPPESQTIPALVPLSEMLASPASWISLITLIALEIVLGIDNIIFISILAGKLPAPRQKPAMRAGLALALITRLLLLFTLSFLASLTSPLFHVGDHGISGRDLILLIGGLFLVAKATSEIYDKVEAENPHDQAHGGAARAAVSYGMILVQIMLLDIVFSIDSVITAVGMVKDLRIMASAVVVAVIVMMFFASAVGDFVQRHPSMKLLALSFLVMIGVLLVAESFHQEIPKGYVYFGMAFAVGVEVVNMRYRAQQTKLRNAVSVLHEEPATP